MSFGVNPTLFLVFVFAAVTIYAIIRTVAPFLEDPRDQMRLEMLDEELEQIERLVAKKSVALQSLQDIEFDYETGKLSEEDYERLKHQHERRAVRVMRRLDEVRGGVDMEDEIDEALQAKLEGTNGSSLASDESGDQPSSSEPAERSCPDCGAELDPDDRFCSKCGLPLDEVEADDPSQSDEDEQNDDDQDDAESHKPGSKFRSGSTEAAAEPDQDEETGRESADRNVTDIRSEATG